MDTKPCEGSEDGLMTQLAQDTWEAVSAGGAIPSPGSTEINQTGTWRTKRPVIDFEQCTHCMICWILCPDRCFDTEQGRLLSVDLDHCKGCGICAAECPRKCIEMMLESEVQ